MKMVTSEIVGEAYTVATSLTDAFENVEQGYKVYDDLSEARDNLGYQWSDEDTKKIYKVNITVTEV
jgi:hypothetical protein